MKKIKVNQIMKCYSALEDFSKLKLDVKTAYSIFLLKKEIEDKKNFAGEEEGKVINSFNPEFCENGSLKFKSEESARAFEKEMQKLYDTELDIENAPISLNFSDLDGQKLTADTLEGIDGIITFE